MTLKLRGPCLVLALLLAGSGIALSHGSALGFLLGLEENPEFQPISIEQGLSNDRINRVFQDSQGFLWIGTTDGLNRYDGHDIRVFRHDPNDDRSIAANWIAGIAEDAHGNLWVLFGIGGIDRFDRDREIFFHHRHDPGDPESLPFDQVTSTHLMEDGSFWLGTNGRGWIELRTGERTGEDTARNTERSRQATPFLRGSDDLEVEFRRVALPDPPRGLASDPAVGFGDAVLAAGFTTSWLESEGTWIGTSGGLFHRSRSGRTLRWIDTRPVSTLAESAGGLVWVGRGDGSVELLDSRNLQIEARLSLPEAGPRETDTPLDGPGPIAPNPGITLIDEDVRGQVWILRAGRLFHYNPSVGSLERVSISARVLDLRTDERGAVALATSRGFGLYDPVHDRVTIHGIGRDLAGEGVDVPGHREQIVRLFEDQGGRLWLETWGNGLQRWNERATHFQHLPIDRVRCLARTADGTVWIGTVAGLHQALAPEGGMGNDMRAASTQLISASIAALAPARGGGLWVATDHTLFLLAGGTPPDDLWQADALINTLLEDGQGRLWIGTNDSLWRLDPGSEVPVRYPDSTSPRDDSIVGQGIHALAEGSDGTIWVGTYVGGLSRLDTDTDRFRHFLFDPDVPTSLNNLSVNQVFVDQRDRIWVGTYSGGLDLLGPESAGFRHFTEREGLAGNQVLGIVEDDSGDLWIATNQGLSRLDPESAEFRNYDWSDGLRSQPFENGACLRDGDGRMLFGGRNGVTRFDPSKVEIRSDPPPVALTALRIEDERVPISEHRGDQTELSFAPHEDFISFEFVGLEFESPTRVRYSYRLEGFDDSWVQCGKRNYAAYTNLDPGRYEFLARATLDGTRWSEPLSITIEVRPPFYRTAWFLGALTLGILTLFWGLHRVRVHQQVRRSLLEERIRVAERERVREQVARDYHDEMGHKLTKLGIFSELVRRSVSRVAPSAERGQLTDYAEKIEDTVQSLVRDTRDFLWTLDPRRDSVYELALYMQEFGRRLFAETDVRFRVDGIEESLRQSRLSADWKRQVSLILKEALTNSLRHANAQEVALRFGIVGDELEILAVDDGTGFEPKDLRERSTGGNGLANMRRRAEAIGGHLLLDSGAERGTRLRFIARAG